MREDGADDSGDKLGGRRAGDDLVGEAEALYAVAAAVLRPPRAARTRRCTAAWRRAARPRLQACRRRPCSYCLLARRDVPGEGEGRGLGVGLALGLGLG